MTLEAGSAAKILVAYGSASLQKDVLPTAAFDAKELERIVRDGVSESSAERDPSLASASVPIFDASGALIAALSISGPVGRIGGAPAERFGSQLKEAARQIEEQLG